MRIFLRVLAVIIVLALLVLFQTVVLRRPLPRPRRMIPSTSSASDLSRFSARARHSSAVSRSPLR